MCLCARAQTPLNATNLTWPWAPQVSKYKEAETEAYEKHGDHGMGELVSKASSHSSALSLLPCLPALNGALPLLPLLLGAECAYWESGQVPPLLLQ